LHRLSPSSTVLDHPPLPPDYPFLARGRHVIGIEVGLLSRTSTTTTTSGSGVATDTRVTGFIGALRYGYWAGQYWTVGVSVGVIAAEASASAGVGETRSESAAVVPLLVAFRFYPPQLALSSSLRLYGSFAVGPYLGFATNTVVGTSIASETVSEAAFGARARAGADLFAGTHVLLGFSVGYNFVSDFDRDIGSDRNYSGLELALGLGFVFGSGRP
jgi:hypothetical protein